MHPQVQVHVISLSMKNRCYLFQKTRRKLDFPVEGNGELILFLEAFDQPTFNQ